MTRERSQRLQRVADVATRRTDAAAHLLADRISGLDAARRQLEELNRFRHEYTLRPDAGPAAAVTIAALRNRQQFIARIDEAIAQQQQNVRQSARRLDEARAAWLQSHSRSVALDHTVDRYRAEERARDERSEQAMLDERAQRPEQPWSTP